MVRFKTIAKFCAESGYTDAAVRGKIREGIWLERRVWRKAPDGHVLIDIEGYNEWVMNGNGLNCNMNNKPQSSPKPLTSARNNKVTTNPLPLK